MSTEKKTKHFRTDEEWLAILKELEAWDGTVEEFAAKRGMRASLIYKNRTRFSRKGKSKPKPKVAKLSGTDKRAKVLELHAQGVRQADIARQLGLTAPAVHYFINTPLKRDAPAASPKAVGPSADVRAAIALLRQMDKEVMRLIRSNKIQAPDRAHMLGMMALRELTGDQ